MQNTSASPVSNQQTITTVAYPPAPWPLTGQLYGSIWTVPQAAFRVKLLPQFEPLVNFGRIGVWAGFVDYQPGSILTYHELLAGVVVRLKGRTRIAFTVTHIWVDDAASRQGGRELWGVPKELANFEFDYRQDKRVFKGIAHREGQPLAEGHFRPAATLPQRVRLPVPFPNLQILHAQPHKSTGTFWSSLQISRGGMSIPASSPLAELGVAGRSPLISFAGRDFKMHLEAAQPV